MSGFLLDTNVVSEQIRLHPEPHVDAWIYGQPEASLFLSAVTIGELHKGVMLLAPSRRRSSLISWLENSLVPRFAGRIMPVTDAVARSWGSLSAQRQRTGRPLGAMDGLIAATALEHDMVLVTRNVKDFGDLGLILLNPWAL